MTNLQTISKRFEMKELIGRGGIGEVYSALDRETNELVAIKILKPSILAGDDDLVARFSREGEALRRLNHPNIVKILDSVTEGDHHCLIMELVTGGTLGDLLKEGQLPIQTVLQVSLELADALSRAHHLKIIHRDIKPANILLAEDGTPRLTDFGIARVGDSHITEAGSVMGTFAYLSPEACRGEVLDVRTDIWSFGVVIYEMLTGKRPFEENQAAALIHSIMTQSIPPIEELRSDVPVAIIDLVYRMLEKNREARIPRMRMVGAEIEAIIEMLDTGMRPVGIVPEAGESLFETPTMEDIPTASTTRDNVIAPTNLPAFTTPFIGRKEELAEIIPPLRDEQHRLITIVGLGGLGKTRLAVDAASQMKQVFFNGVYFVPLAPVTAVDTIVSTIADNIGFTFSGSGDQQAELVCYLREKKILLLLDNFEHLIEGADLLTEILEAAPYVSILVTSRERLRLKGENVFELDTMKSPTEDISVDTLNALPSVQLFIESARRVLGDFELTEETAPHVARIIQLVQGMPLGIELAAAWLEMLPAEEIVAEIERSLDFLETDLRDVPERHRSIRAVFEYSWNLMTDDERDVFMKLSVFRGGFERDAAQEITGASLRNLMTLVNKSLLRRSADGRYSAQKLLREYAEERFAEMPDILATTRDAHAKFYAKFAADQVDGFSTRRENKSADKIELELQNIRLAWKWAIEHEMWDTLNPMIEPMTLFFQARSLLREGAMTFKKLAEVLQAKGLKETLYWRARLRESLLSGRIGDYKLSYDYAKDALTFFQQQHNEFEQSYALNLLSYATMMQGQYVESVEFASRAAKLAYNVEDTGQIFTSLGNLGYAKFLQGNYPEALQIYEELIQLGENAEYSPIGRGFGLNNLGEILMEMGELERARDLFEAAYEIFKSFNTRRGMAFTMNNLAGVHVFMDDLQEAQDLYQKAYRLNKDIGDRNGMGHSLSALGNGAFFTNDYESAKRYYTEALAVRREIGNRRNVAESLDDLAHTYLATRQMKEARNCFAESIAIRQEIGDRLGMATSLLTSALADKLDGKFEEAFEQLNKAHKIASELKHAMTLAQVEGGLGDFYASVGQYDDAMLHLRASLERARKMNIINMALYNIASVAHVKAGQKHYKEAVEIAAYVVAQPVRGFDLGLMKGNQVLDIVRPHLSHAEFKQAEAQGQQLTIETIVGTILNA